MKTLSEIIASAQDNPNEYRYGMTLRPLSLGMCPDGFLRMDAPDPRFDAASRHGVLVYDQPLDGNETKNFELPLLVTKESNHALAQALLENCNNSYIGDYVEEIDESFAQERIIRFVDSLHDGLLTLESEADFIDAFVQLYYEKEKVNNTFSPSPSM